MIDFSNHKLLVISPHCDDETLMAGGLLQKVECSKIAVLAAGPKDIYVTKRRIPQNLRLAELYEAVSYYPNCEVHTPFSISDDQLYENEQMRSAISYLDKVIDEFKPTLVVVPGISHHQDHKFADEAAIAACRPSPYGEMIQAILIGSYPHRDMYDVAFSHKSYLYVRLTEQEANIKLSAMKVHKSQLPDNRYDWLSESSLKLLMQYIGLECHSDYAERFEVLRIVV